MTVGHPVLVPECNQFLRGKTDYYFRSLWGKKIIFRLKNTQNLQPRGSLDSSIVPTSIIVATSYESSLHLRVQGEGTEKSPGWRSVLTSGTHQGTPKTRAIPEREARPTGTYSYPQVVQSNRVYALPNPREIVFTARGCTQKAAPAGIRGDKHNEQGILWRGRQLPRASCELRPCQPSC